MSGEESPKRLLVLGDARQVHLVRWASHFAARGYDVLVASLEDVGHIDTPKRHIDTSEKLPPFLRYPLATPAVRRIIREFRPHLVNAHFLPNYGLIATLCRHHPWVLSTWGSDVMVLPRRSPFHNWRTRTVIRAADAITSDADVMSERLIELGADPDSVTTFPYGVDRRLFYPSGDHWSTEGPRIITNRKLEAVYSVETVVSAFARLKKKIPGAELTVAGDGSLATALRHKVQATGYLHSVDLCGAVAHADMPALLRRHDIYVSMALSDTTSVSLLEAMACGLFPIVSDIPANREWIEHDKNGMLVPVRHVGRLAAAIEAAWHDEVLRASAIAHNAILVRERADWFKNMAVVERLFESLIGARR